MADDSPLWGEEYEVELTEVFRVQSEIAQQVTTALDIALRAPEQASLAAAGTSTPEAYDFYLRGNEYASRSYSRGNIEAAADLYRKAVALDSTFALAWARLGRAHSAMYWFYYDRSPARLDSARVAVETALRLAPDLAEGRIARGYYYYWGLVDYRRALEEFEAARRQQPSNSELLSAIGYVERRRGQWDSALARFQEAVRYDPRSALRTLDLADTLHVDCATTPRRSGASTGRSSWRPTGPSPTPTRRCSSWSGGATGPRPRGHRPGPDPGERRAGWRRRC